MRVWMRQFKSSKVIWSDIIILTVGLTWLYQNFVAEKIFMFVTDIIWLFDNPWPVLNRVELLFLENLFLIFERRNTGIFQ